MRPKRLVSDMTASQATMHAMTHPLRRRSRNSLNAIITILFKRAPPERNAVAQLSDRWLPVNVDRNSRAVRLSNRGWQDCLRAGRRRASRVAQRRKLYGWRRAKWLRALVRRLKYPGASPARPDR